MKIDYCPIDDFIPYKLNAKMHPKEQIEGLAESIRKFGFTQPVVVDMDNNVIVGHGRIEAAKLAGLKELPIVILHNLTPEEVKAYRIIDNKIAESPWDIELLSKDLADLDFDFEPFNIDLPIIDSIEAKEADDVIPDVPTEAITKPGDIWLCGDHRVMCGDSTIMTDMDKLLNGCKIDLLHADPPYGMGKENEGVINDNLYGSKLDEFQISWILNAYLSLTDNASIYIWGNAYDLWRLWFKGSFGEMKDLNEPTELVWSKVHSGGAFDAHGQSSEEMKIYPIASERCLFIKRGATTGLKNSNEYWNGWDPIRLYLCEQKELMKWSSIEIDEITNTKNMSQHWFTKSQWTMIKKKEYKSLQKEAEGKAFTKPWQDLWLSYEEIKIVYYNQYAYFNNSHDNMADVWSFERVKGDDRHGHATPKPIKLMERILKTSCPQNGLCFEPFGGSGTTLAASEATGRICYTMELSPQYCDVIVKRWQKMTGLNALHAETGEIFKIEDEIKLDNEV